MCMWCGISLLRDNSHDSVTIQTEFTDETAVKFDHRHPGIVFFTPIITAVHIDDFDIELLTHQRQQFLNQLLAQMAAPAAINCQGRQSGTLTQSLLDSR